MIDLITDFLFAGVCGIVLFGIVLKAKKMKDKNKAKEAKPENKIGDASQ